MNEDVLSRLKRCPYCWVFNETISVEFDVAFRSWKHYDGDRNELLPHHTNDDDIIVFCQFCGDEILENDIPEVEL